MMTFNPTSWYWLASNGTIYSSADGNTVPANNSDYVNFLNNGGIPSRWPSDTNGSQTFAALDEVLMSYGVAPSGEDISILQEALLSAVSNACSSVIMQIYPDPTHQAAAQNAAIIIMQNDGSMPSSGTLFYNWLLTFAQSWGYTSETLSNFANLTVTLTNQSFNLSSILNTITSEINGASTANQLNTALTTFETEIGNLVITINEAGPPIPIVTPPSIVIKGINS